MGRPSKLDDRQKAEIGRRLAAGESMGDLSREFKVGKTTLSRHFSGRPETIRQAASMLANAETVVEQMPVSEQVSVRTLADQLKGLSKSLIETAEINSRTSKILAQKGAKAVHDLGDAPTVDDLRLPAAFMEISNKANDQGIKLLNATKTVPTEEHGSVTVYSGVPRG